MKKMYFWSIVSILILATLGYFLGWTDNGPKKIDTESIPNRFEE